HVVIGPETFDRPAEQRRIVAGHGRHDEQARLRPARRMLEGALEMYELAERALPGGRDMNGDLLATHHGRIDIPLRFAVTARRAFEQFKASRESSGECGV